MEGSFELVSVRELTTPPLHADLEVIAFYIWLDILENEEIIRVEK